jgi:hypothetical protein
MRLPPRFLPLLLAAFPAVVWGEEPRPATPAPAPASFSWSGAATNATGTVLARIRVDTRETPDLAEWGQQAGEHCAEWYGRIAALLPSDGFQPYGEVTLIFRADMGGVAVTGGNNIFIAAQFVRKHRDDFGMVIHELVHVVQAYPPGGPGWLVEGIADYIRLTHFEPKAPRPMLDPAKARYTDAYKTAALFLEWAEKNGHPGLVAGLNAALRQQRYRAEVWEKLTGKTVDQLWADFAATLPKR